MDKNADTTISTSPILVKGFLLKIIIWLPIIFVAWYILTPVIVYLLSFLLKTTLTLLASNAVLDVEQQGHVLHIITRFAAEKTNDINKGQLVFVVNAMKYGYGMALFVAMLLATPDKLSNKLQNLFIGLSIILIVQLWGVTFDSMMTLVFKLGRGIGETMGTTEFTREVIVLCYQLGYLILPAVAPIILWFTMYQNQLAKLAPKFAKIKE